MNIISQTIAWLTNPLNWQGPNGIPTRMEEHIVLSGVSLLLAFAIAFPLGLFIGHTGRAATLVVNVANLGRALPSLAIIAIVLPITAAIDPQAGFTYYPTVVAMVVLGIPPILVNTYSGLTGVDRETLEAGRGMGMKEGQLLRRVELPLSVPVIVAGVRSAAVQIVATATLGAIFGGPGLGRYLVDGYAQLDTGQIWGGVVLVAGLAIATELFFSFLQQRLTSRGLRLEQEQERTGFAAGADAPELEGAGAV